MGHISTSVDQFTIAEYVNGRTLREWCVLEMKGSIHAVNQVLNPPAKLRIFIHDVPFICNGSDSMARRYSRHMTYGIVTVVSAVISACKLLNAAED